MHTIIISAVEVDGDLFGYENGFGSSVTRFFVLFSSFTLLSLLSSGAFQPNANNLNEPTRHRGTNSPREKNAILVLFEKLPTESRL